jgi:hypothetical protein
MTKLEELKMAYDAACDAAVGDCADAWSDDAWSDAWNDYQDGLKKLQEEETND